VECFFIGKQNVVLFPKFRENGWVSAASALTPVMWALTVTDLLQMGAISFGDNRRFQILQKGRRNWFFQFIFFFFFFFFFFFNLFQ
jgi:hypothetical protein